MTDLGSDGGSDLRGNGVYGGADSTLGDGDGDDEGNIGEKGRVESEAHHIEYPGVMWMKVLIEVVRRRSSVCWLVDVIVDEGDAAELERDKFERRVFIYTNPRRMSEGSSNEYEQLVPYCSMMHSQAFKGPVDPPLQTSGVFTNDACDFRDIVMNSVWIPLSRIE